MLRDAVHTVALAVLAAGGAPRPHRPARRRRQRSARPASPTARRTSSPPSSTRCAADTGRSYGRRRDACAGARHRAPRGPGPARPHLAPAGRESILLQGARIALADGPYTPAEREVLATVGAALTICADDVTRLLAAAAHAVLTPPRDTPREYPPAPVTPGSTPGLALTRDDRALPRRKSGERTRQPRPKGGPDSWGPEISSGPDGRRAARSAVPWVVLGLWVGVLALASPFAAEARRRTARPGRRLPAGERRLDPGSRRSRSSCPAARATELVLVYHRDGGLTAADRTAAAEQVARIAGRPRPDRDPAGRPVRRRHAP